METARISTRPRLTRRALGLALVGCWVASGLGGAVFAASEITNDERLGAALIVIFPIYLVAVLPYWLDTWRNPHLSTATATLWVGAVGYLPFAAATIYWWRFAPRPGEAPSPPRDEPRTSGKLADLAFSGFVVFSLVVLVGWVGYLALVLTGVVK